MKNDSTVWRALGGGGHAETVSELQRYGLGSAVLLAVVMAIAGAVDVRDRRDFVSRRP